MIGIDSYCNEDRVWVATKAAFVHDSQIYLLEPIPGPGCPQRYAWACQRYQGQDRTVVEVVGILQCSCSTQAQSQVVDSNSLQARVAFRGTKGA